MWSGPIIVFSCIDVAFSNTQSENGADNRYCSNRASCDTQYGFILADGMLIYSFIFIESNRLMLVFVEAY